jgi:hydroxymethylpyrimidine/phosphomethylpyrimidine kinase
MSPHEPARSPPAVRARLLIVAGHDSSAGAGIDADVESVRELPIEPLTVVTAYTDQDAHGVREIGARDPDEWLAEALEIALHDAIAEHEIALDDLITERDNALHEASTEHQNAHHRAIAERETFPDDAASPSRHARPPIAAVKIGLLPGFEHVHAASRLVVRLRALHGETFPIVVDPVMSSSSGTKFMDGAAIAALRRTLVPRGIVLTPNVDELAALCRASAEELAREPASRAREASKLLAEGARAVIVKGGHCIEDPVRDLVAVAGGRMTWLEHARVSGGKIRGSGCRFATRVAARLALGSEIEAAAKDAGEYVSRLIRASAVRG